MSLAPAVEAASGVSRPRSPYVGLVPYDEGDAAFFFGRSTEAAIVAMNLRAARLTILYGPSGVGKSSLLMAGAVHDLREDARTAAAESPFAVCVLRSWRDDPVHGLREVARTALQELTGTEPLPPPAATLAETFRAWTDQTGTLLVVLDQFEEYFQYHPDEGNDERLTGFAAELARIVNDPSLPVHVLLSIREDGWAKLDLFEGHIPLLFANYVRVDHLDLDAAREAVEGPIEAWNRTLTEDEQPFEIEPELVEAVLAATAGGRLTLTAGSESPAAETAGDRVEAPFLQLVLDRLWRDTIPAGEHTLTLARLEALGGAARIVENHLLDALGRLTPTEQDVAAGCFRFLVSSGRTKIAHPASDLAEWTGRPDTQVTEVLDKLCTGESGRILRAVAPAQDGGSTSYELFHDILAEPILAWRKEYEQRRAQEAEAERQRLARRRLVLGGSVALGLAVVFASLAALALIEWRHTDRLNRSINSSNDALKTRIAALNKEAAAAEARVSQDKADVESLRETNRSLTAETTGLKKKRNNLDQNMRKLRATNRRLAGDIDRLNVANAALAKKINTLERDYEELLFDEESLSAQRSSLQRNTVTLEAENRALSAQLAALVSEHGRLVQKALELGLEIPGPILPPQQVGSAGPSVTQPTTAAQFLVPGDVAGSDKLRQEVAALDKLLAKLLEEKAKLTDEARWLRGANDLLLRQRSLLRAEVGQLEKTQAALELRQGELQQTKARASAENQKLSSRAGTLEARNAKERKQVEKQQQANANLQDANSGTIDDMAFTQAAISSQRFENQALVEQITVPLRKLLQGARGLPDDPEVAALLAVDAYRVAPYDPDDPAHPAVLDALWLALTRLDANAAQNLTAAPRSALVENKLCALARRPLTSDELSRLRGFLPQNASSTLQHPCG